MSTTDGAFLFTFCSLLSFVWAARLTEFRKTRERTDVDAVRGYVIDIVLWGTMAVITIILLVIP